MAFAERKYKMSSDILQMFFTIRALSITHAQKQIPSKQNAISAAKQIFQPMPQRSHHPNETLRFLEGSKIYLDSSE